MTKHNEVLERLAKSQCLEQAIIDLEIEAGVFSNGGENLSTRNDFPCQEQKPSTGSKSRVGSSRFRKKKQQNVLGATPSLAKESSRHTVISGQSASQGVEFSDNGGHDADDDSGDGEGPLNQDIAFSATRETSQNIPNEPRYALLSVNRKLLQVPVDSATYQLAAGPLASNNNQTCLQASPNAVRVEEVVDSLSESEWDEAKYLPMEELMDFLTSAQNTAYGSDVEATTSEPSSPITIDSHCESHIFISQTVNLALCRTNAESTVRKFCIERVSITGHTQVFCAIEPCMDERNPKCKHITMEIEEGDDLSSKELPCKTQLSSLWVGDRSCDALSDRSSRWNDSVASFNFGRGRDPARSRWPHYTLFDQDGRTECPLPIELFASIQIMTDDSDVITERAPSGPEEDTGQTKQDKQEGQMVHDAGFPTYPDPRDNEYAFNLLRMIILYDIYRPPHKIELDVLIQFLSLMDKYREHVGDKALKQAKSWALLIQPSEELDQNAMPWLWIMWKLCMRSEFKKLSATIQRQSRFSFSHWQDELESKHGIKLPELILGIHVEASWNYGLSADTQCRSIGQKAS